MSSNLVKVCATGETCNSVSTKHIQLAWTDLASITRCHFVKRDRFDADVKKNGMSIASCFFSFPYMYDVPTQEPIGQVKFIPDAVPPPRPIPWLSGAAVCFGKFYDGDSPWSYCPRSFLSRQEKKLEEVGIKMVVGFELEFFLLNNNGYPTDSTVYAETKSLHGKSWPIISRIVDVLDIFEIPIWQYHSEAAAGQFEFSIGPFAGSMLDAADALVLTRETIYHVAAEFGTKATFAPKPFSDLLASGAHTHISLQTNNSANLFKVHADAGNSFLAGIFENLPNLMLILAPTGNSYERLQPSTWSGAFQCIGTENKEAAIRLMRNTEGTLERFELKSPDGTANPYLLLGSLMGAGIHGIQNRLSLPQEINVDPAKIPTENRPGRLPSSLAEALEKFKENKFTRQLFGEELAKLLVDLRVEELKYWESPTESYATKLKLFLERY